MGVGGSRVARDLYGPRHFASITRAGRLSLRRVLRDAVLYPEDRIREKAAALYDHYAIVSLPVSCINDPLQFLRVAVNNRVALYIIFFATLAATVLRSLRGKWPPAWLQDISRHERVLSASPRNPRGSVCIVRKNAIGNLSGDRLLFRFGYEGRNVSRWLSGCDAPLPYARGCVFDLQTRRYWRGL